MCLSLGPSSVSLSGSLTPGPPSLFLPSLRLSLYNFWIFILTLSLSVDENGCYNLDKAGEWRIFADMAYISAMVHPGGGRNDVPHRLKRQFNLIIVTMPSLGAINNIFGSIMSGRLSTVSPFHAVSK